MDYVTSDGRVSARNHIPRFLIAVSTCRGEFLGYVARPVLSTTSHTNQAMVFSIPADAAQFADGLTSIAGSFKLSIVNANTGKEVG